MDMQVTADDLEFQFFCRFYNDRRQLIKSESFSCFNSFVDSTSTIPDIWSYAAGFQFFCRFYTAKISSPDHGEEEIAVSILL